MMSSEGRGFYAAIASTKLLGAIRAKSSPDFEDLRHRQQIKVIGIVTGRQRPSTAAGVIFVTLEVEHGMINVIVWRNLAERQRSALMHSRLLQVKGTFVDKWCAAFDRWASAGR